MKRMKLLLTLLVLIFATSITKAQEENNLKISGELLTDDRVLLKDNNNWAWNENFL